MDPIDGVTFLQGDFREQEVADKLTEIIGDKQVDLVLSDMAPNLSGIAAADAARCLLSQYVETLKKHFKTVLTRKPEASRDTSAEVYMVAKHIKKR